MVGRYRSRSAADFRAVRFVPRGGSSCIRPGTSAAGIHAFRMSEISRIKPASDGSGRLRQPCPKLSADIALLDEVAPFDGAARSAVMRAVPGACCLALESATTTETSHHRPE